MKPAPVTPAAASARPWARPIVVGPPINDSIGCQPVEALVGSTLDEGTTFRIPWLPEPGDVEALQAGEPIWLVLWCPQMPPVALTVGPQS